MEVSVIRPNYLDEYNLDRDDFYIVIDTFRATTTLSFLASFGSKNIYVVNDKNDAIAVKKQFCKDCLLIGEERGIKIKGFDFGNSPSELVKEDVRNKDVIFTSSNGAKTLVKLKRMNNIFLGALVNLTTLSTEIANLAFQSKKNIILIPAGNYHKPEKFVLEDWITSALIVENISKIKDFTVINRDKYWDKTTKILNKGEDLTDLIIGSRNARYLAKIGYQNDVLISTMKDEINNLLKVKKWLKIDESNCVVLE